MPVAGLQAPIKDASLKHSLLIEGDRGLMVLLLVAYLVPLVLSWALPVAHTWWSLTLLGIWSAGFAVIGYSQWRWLAQPLLVKFNDQGDACLVVAGHLYPARISRQSLPSGFCCLLHLEFQPVGVPDRQLRRLARFDWLLLCRTGMDDCDFRRLNRVIRLRRQAATT